MLLLYLVIICPSNTFLSLSTPLIFVISLAYDLEWWYPLLALLVGLLLAATTFHLFEDQKHPGRIVLCFVGFFVAMVWILTIVGEVVGVLQVSYPVSYVFQD